MDSVLNNERVIITSKNGNIILINETEWNELIETMYLLSDPDMLSAVKEVNDTPTSDLEAVDWKNML